MAKAAKVARDCQAIESPPEIDRHQCDEYRHGPEHVPRDGAEGLVELARIRTGPVFRPVDRHGNVLPRRLSAQVVALVVKRAAVEAGLDPNLFSGHSLRAGFVTTAKVRGVDDAAIMEVTGHQTLAMAHAYHRRTKR